MRIHVKNVVENGTVVVKKILVTNAKLVKSCIKELVKNCPKEILTHILVYRKLKKMRRMF